MKIRLAGWLAVGFGLGLAASACTLASPSHIDVVPSEDTGAGDGGTKLSTTSTSACDAGSANAGSIKFTKADVSTLTACGNGKGHCYDTNKVPGGASSFVACPGSTTQLCVEDSILEANGNKLKSCNSVIGAGTCVDMDLLNVPPDAKSQLSLLKPDVCDSGELCVPCIDPRNNQPNPLCGSVGVSADVLSDATASASASCAATGSATTATDGGASTGSAMPGCCTTNGKSNGVCIATSAIPTGSEGSTIQDTCATGTTCAPAAMVQGKTATCESGLLGTGVCIDKCFSSMMGIASSFGILSSDGCGSTEVCVACTLIGLGSSTAIPGCPSN